MANQTHEVVFSMSTESHDRVLALLARCGHSKLNLLLARGLALVEYVLDQGVLGRSVGSVSATGNKFVPLCERPELSTPPNGSRGASESPCERSVDAGACVSPINPKLMPRPRVPVETVVVECEPRARRLFRHAAFAVNDDAGPVRSLAYHRERSETMETEPPIDFNGHALPGGLCLSHLEALRRVMDSESMATHFQLCPASDLLLFYGFFPNNGWFRLNCETREWVPDGAVRTGEVSVFPMDTAEFYLRRLRDKSQEPHLLQA